MNVPFFGTRAVSSSEDNRGVEMWNGWSKRSGRKDGWNLEVGQDQIGNQVYTTVQCFYNLGKCARLSLSFRLAKVNLPLKSRPAVSMAISSEIDGVKRDARPGIDSRILSKRLFPRSLTFTDSVSSSEFSFLAWCFYNGCFVIFNGVRPHYRNGAHYRCKRNGCKARTS